MTIKLYVGERNYSSWSLRPWLVLKWSGLAFEDHFISLDQFGYGKGKIEPILAVSPSGRLPALDIGGRSIWDSLAISEWVAEQVPGARLWPEDPGLRGEARAITCEMHSGFPALRRDLPMNIRRRCERQAWPEDTQIDLDRIRILWSKNRARFAAMGSFLFGHRTIADAFYLPVACRLRSYGVSLSPEADTYRDILLQDSAFLEWERRAEQEWKRPFSRAAIDALYEEEVAGPTS